MTDHFLHWLIPTCKRNTWVLFTHSLFKKTYKVAVFPELSFQIQRTVYYKGCSVTCMTLPPQPGGFSVLVLIPGYECLHPNEGSNRGDCMILEYRGKWAIMSRASSWAQHTKQADVEDWVLALWWCPHIGTIERVEIGVDDMEVYSWLWPRGPPWSWKVIAKSTGLQTSYLHISTEDYCHHDSLATPSSLAIVEQWQWKSKGY